MPALTRKIHTAKKENQEEVVVWGTGSPMREFLHVDDLAAACIFLMKNYNGEQHVNIGSGTDVSIKELAMMIQSIIGYKGELKFDS